MLAAGGGPVARWPGHKSIRAIADTCGHLVSESWEPGRRTVEATMRPQTKVIKGARRAARQGSHRPPGQSLTHTCRRPPKGKLGGLRQGAIQTLTPKSLAMPTRPEA
ncbi:hypothetical protein GCM10022420_024070 [Streptomyces iranensis]